MKQTTFQIDPALSEAIQARQIELDGIQRMLARPLATMTVEEQEEYEQKKH